jgi:quinol monooxygenase YgiN
MPLKLTDITHKSSTSLLNKWADENDTTINNHSQAIQQLQAQVQALLKQVNKS